MSTFESWEVSQQLDVLRGKPHLPQLDIYHDMIKEAGFPYELRPFQAESLSWFGPQPRSGLFYAPGTGKTIASLALAYSKLLLGQVERVLVILPPVLIENWRRNIAPIPGAKVVTYAGSPVERRKIDLRSGNFILMSLAIFKRDMETIELALRGDSYLVIVDESQTLKNPGSSNYRDVRDFSNGQQLCLLTGTPVSVPEDAYATIQLLTPGIYGSQHQFENIHVAERHYVSNKPLKYRMLDVLAQNLALVSHRVLLSDVVDDLPELNYVPLHYNLDPRHHKLYLKMVEEEIVKFSNGEELDLENASTMWSALQQVVMNAEYYSEGKCKSTGFEIVDAVRQEIGPRKKLVIFVHYRRTTQALLNKFASEGVVAEALWGGTPASDRQAVIDNFVNGEPGRVLILQHRSGGVGVDRLQDTCSDGLVLELPFRASDMHQSAARLHRTGQKNPVTIRVAIASGTLQVRTWRFLRENDDLVSTVLRGETEFRDALVGG